MGNKPGSATRGNDVGPVSTVTSNSPEGRPSTIKSEEAALETEVIPEESTPIAEEPVK